MSAPGSLTVSAAVYAALAAAGVLTSAGLAAGEDFKVENQVFLDRGEKPQSHSTTIFHDGLVYDYLDQPAEVIVFDSLGGRFTLLDTARRVRAELTAREVLAFTQQLQQRAEAHQDAFVKFLAAPRFDEKYDETSGELTLSSPWMTYRLLLARAPSRQIPQQYREFSDWYARLNTLLSPGSRPPFARLAVNAALASRQSTAREVHLTLNPEGPSGNRTTIRSTHRLVRPLEQADLDRVAETDKSIKAFKPLGLEQYRRPEPP
jgi:hypothetical protein